MKKARFKDIDYSINMTPQPDDTTCGPTCLFSLYKHLGLQPKFKDILSEVRYLDTGGTLGEALGIDALERGLKTTIYTHNLNTYDPTWFQLNKQDQLRKLKKQLKVKKTKKIIKSTKLLIEFLNLGGEVKFAPLDVFFLYHVLKTSGPAVVGLSSTYLYRCERERNSDNEYDDIRGYPQGHFVILSGISKDLKKVHVFDPLVDNPISKKNNYIVKSRDFINSILIGALTYDANILLIER